MSQSLCDGISVLLYRTGGPVLLALPPWAFLKTLSKTHKGYAPVFFSATVVPRLVRPRAVRRSAELVLDAVLNISMTSLMSFST